MNNSGSMGFRRKLRTLYDERKIGVCQSNITFCCSHFECCKKAAAAKGRELSSRSNLPPSASVYRGTESATTTAKFPWRRDKVE